MECICFQHFRTDPKKYRDTGTLLVEYSLLEVEIICLYNTIPIFIFKMSRLHLIL